MVMMENHAHKAKLLLLLVPIFAAVAISGCTQTSGPSSGPGIVILNWEPTFSSVESGDNLQLRLQIQNQGTLVAQDVRAVLTGISTDEWGLALQSTKSFGDLIPYNTVQQTAGEERQTTFDLVAPTLKKGTVLTYNPQVRVYYHYKTTAIKPITLVNENELKRLQDQGETVTSGDTQSSSGPLKVTMTTGKFIKAKDYGFSKNIFPITIMIQNTGGGVVSTMNVPENDYKVNVKVDFPSRLTGDCGTGGIFMGGDVTLWKGQDTTLTCQVHINTPPLATEEATIKVTLEYDYYTESKTAITVTGTDEGYW
jgi:hypothetical protein